jgi:hypothetical protein
MSQKRAPDGKASTAGGDWVSSDASAARVTINLAGPPRGPRLRWRLVGDPEDLDFRVQIPRERPEPVEE